MTLAHIIGGTLLLVGFAFVLVANFSHWKMLEDLSQKYPERLDYFFGPNWPLLKTFAIEREFKANFPASRRLRNSRLFFLLAAISGFSGFWLLMWPSQQ